MQKLKQDTFDILLLFQIHHLEQICQPHVYLCPSPPIATFPYNGSRSWTLDRDLSLYCLRTCYFLSVTVQILSTVLICTARLRWVALANCISPRISHQLLQLGKPWPKDLIGQAECYMLFQNTCSIVGCSCFMRDGPVIYIVGIGIIQQNGLYFQEFS